LDPSGLGILAVVAAAQLLPRRSFHVFERAQKTHWAALRNVVRGDGLIAAFGAWKEFVFILIAVPSDGGSVLKWIGGATNQTTPCRLHEILEIHINLEKINESMQKTHSGEHPHAPNSVRSSSTAHLKNQKTNPDFQMRKASARDATVVCST
jgi:hypothetical protein